MSHIDTVRLFGLVGLLCGSVSAITQRKQGRLKGGAFALSSIGLALWAIGLALSFAGI